MWGNRIRLEDPLQPHETDSWLRYGWPPFRYGLAIHQLEDPLQEADLTMIWSVHRHTITI